MRISALCNKCKKSVHIPSECDGTFGKIDVVAVDDVKKMFVNFIRNYTRPAHADFKLEYNRIIDALSKTQVDSEKESIS